MATPGTKAKSYITAGDDAVHELDRPDNHQESHERVDQLRPRRRRAQVVVVDVHQDAVPVLRPARGLGRGLRRGLGRSRDRWGGRGRSGSGASIPWCHFCENWLLEKGEIYFGGERRACVEKSAESR